MYAPGAWHAQSDRGNRGETGTKVRIADFAIHVDMPPALLVGKPHTPVLPDLPRVTSAYLRNSM
jgi:hypothetical protein